MAFYREVTIQTDRGRLVLPFTSDRALQRFCLKAMQHGYRTCTDTASIKTYSNADEAFESLRDFGEPGEAPAAATARQILDLINREAARYEKTAAGDGGHDGHPIVQHVADRQAVALRNILGRVTAHQATPRIRSIGPEGD